MIINDKDLSQVNASDFLYNAGRHVLPPRVREREQGANSVLFCSAIRRKISGLVTKKTQLISVGATSEEATYLVPGTLLSIFKMQAEISTC